MIQTKKIGSLTQLTATNGYVHKIGTDTYVQTIIMLPTETLDMYEEVAEKPAYTKAEYDKLVAELVRERYTESEEFAIQRKAINAAFSPSVANAETAMTEYQVYNAYVEECKQRAKNPELYEYKQDEMTVGE